ncbi:MAG TPA: carboxypeptidase regulatory-like domain-containing protein [Acidobacteriaceae bacterium]|jgi:hypothetical protein|nr:carboxypeptidase regulatory-like domain-containing protein [Acidobacteriaceae bacterium]
MKKLFAALLLMVAPVFALGQAISMTGGSIQGTITDPSGAAIPGATIVITNPDTGYAHTSSSDSAGFYSVGPLTPGNYSIDVTAAGFQHLKVATVVRVGTATAGSERLTVGSQAETIEVNAGAVQINTDQIGVAGVVTQQQIDTLPVNGRNILDIAQLEPGVILQSGQDFDPTKTGYSALSLNGINGRTTRVIFDGQDISDETVGTVVYNVPEGAVSEFQLNRSTQDISGSVTSTGQVLFASQSGTNRFHGNAFYNFQDHRVGFALNNGADTPFQRNQFGGYVGGYIIKDKLFFFGGAERIKQSEASTSGNSNFFQAIYTQYGTIPNPFKDTFSIARLDYNAPWGLHLFARATYSNNAGAGTSGLDPYSVFTNQDNVPAIVGGGDFTTGKFTHSIRFGYLKFINNIVDATGTLGSSIYNPSAIAGYPLELGGAISAGPNELAPQSTYQSSKQFRYDGTWTEGKHNIKFGGEVARILGGGYAKFFGASVFEDISTAKQFLLPTCANPSSVTPYGGIDPATGQCPGDPLYGYSPEYFYVGNGIGTYTDKPGFGLAGGGEFSWRVAAYLGDTWKVTPSVTVVAGLRWSVDTNRANQDLPTPTCGTVDPSLQFSGCDDTTPSTPLFNFYDPTGTLGLGKRVHQPYANFGPQLGFVFSPGSHKLSVRGGAGLYYESNLFNNTSNARTPVIQAQGKYLNYNYAFYNQSSINLPGLGPVSGLTATGTPCTPGTTGCTALDDVLSESVAQAGVALTGLENAWAAVSNVNGPNLSYVGTGGALAIENSYAGPYLSPYSIQLNGGMQYELSKGIILSVDYLHNAILKIPLNIDTNHTGAARTLNVAAAQNAIAATLSQYGATSIDDAINDGADIDSFADNGLDSLDDYLGGIPASAYSLPASQGAAFPGLNTNVGDGKFILPMGKSAYDALQVVVQGQKAHPLPYINSSNFSVAYSLSRSISNSKAGSGQFFASSGAEDQDCVNCYIGRTDMDHTNQLTFGGSIGVKYGLQLGVVGHFYSAPPVSLDLGSISTILGGTDGAIGIFNSDVDGDGQTGDLLPGTGIGSYGHQVTTKSLNKVIANYNATEVGKITPAGQALVSAGLMTQQQLVALGATLQPLQLAPTLPAISGAPIRDFDLSIKYPIHLNKLHEGLTITPAYVAYNVANMSNFGAFSGLAEDDGSDPTGSLNGPNTKAVQNTARVFRATGSGTYDAGGPRTSEFQLKLDF